MAAIWLHYGCAMFAILLH
jgi:uncharacterized protein YjbI with pentapeptide repeats